MVGDNGAVLSHGTLLYDADGQIIGAIESCAILPIARTRSGNCGI